jgi:GNAT superfamily N-acetyltransferase
MASIRQLGTDEDLAQVGELFREYLEWVNARWKADLGNSYDMQSILEHDMAKLEIFSPPYGRLLLATKGSRVAGVACLRRIGKEIGEIKRMYVRPEFRGMGIGRTLLEALIVEAPRDKLFDTSPG